jgi:hypothetical protein
MMNLWKGYLAKAEQLIEMIKPISNSDLRTIFTAINPEGSNMKEIFAKLFKKHKDSIDNNFQDCINSMFKIETEITKKAKEVAKHLKETDKRLEMVKCFYGIMSVIEHIKKEMSQNDLQGDSIANIIANANYLLK